MTEHFEFIVCRRSFNSDIESHRMKSYSLQYLYGADMALQMSPRALLYSQHNTLRRVTR